MTDFAEKFLSKLVGITTRPWRHPLILVAALGMLGIGFYFLVNGVVALAYWLEPVRPDSLKDKLLKQEFVPDWPFWMAGTLWISLATGAIIKCLFNGYKWCKTIRRGQVNEFKDLDDLTLNEIALLGVLVEDADCPYEKLTRMWT